MHRHLVDLLKKRRAFEQTIRLRRPPLRRRRPMPRPRQPDHIRLAYFAALRRHVLLPAKRLVEERIISELPSIVSAAGVARARGGRTDADPGDVDPIMKGIAIDFEDYVSTDDFEDLAQSFADATSEFQRQQLAQQLRAAVGVEVPIADPHLGPMIETFTATNVALIKSIPSRYFEQVETKLMTDVSAGKRWEQIADDLEQRFEVSESTARLIARDQVGKFFGALNQVRQKDLGIEGFIWRTMKDNRVREEHEELEGERFTWNDLPSEGAPGDAVNCRCWAEPDVQSVVDDLSDEDAA